MRITPKKERRGVPRLIFKTGRDYLVWPLSPSPLSPVISERFRSLLFFRIVVGPGPAQCHSDTSRAKLSLATSYTMAWQPPALPYWFVPALVLTTASQMSILTCRFLSSSQAPFLFRLCTADPAFLHFRSGLCGGIADRSRAPVLNTPTGGELLRVCRKV